MKPRNRLEDPEWSERIDRLINYIREGQWTNTACKKVGLTTKTFYQWLEDARNNKSPAHVEFLRRVNEATADCEMDVIRTIKTICTKNEYIPGLIWYVERKFGNNWAAPAQQVRVVQEINDQLEGFLKKAEQVLGPEMAAKLARNIVEDPDSIDVESLQAVASGGSIGNIDESNELDELSEETKSRILTHNREQ